MADISKLIVSILTLAMFGAAATYILLHQPSEATQQMILTALVAWTGNVIGYYIGSSAGSSAKDKTITTLAAPTPADPKGP